MTGGKCTNNDPGNDSHEMINKTNKSAIMSDDNRGNHPSAAAYHSPFFTMLLVINIVMALLAVTSVATTIAQLNNSTIQPLDGNSGASSNYGMVHHLTRIVAKLTSIIQFPFKYIVLKNNNVNNNEHNHSISITLCIISMILSFLYVKLAQKKLMFLSLNMPHANRAPPSSLSSSSSSSWLSFYNGEIPYFGMVHEFIKRRPWDLMTGENSVD